VCRVPARAVEVTGLLAASQWRVAGRDRSIGCYRPFALSVGGSEDCHQSGAPGGRQVGLLRDCAPPQHTVLCAPVTRCCFQCVEGSFQTAVVPPRLGGLKECVLPCGGQLQSNTCLSDQYPPFSCSMICAVLVWRSCYEGMCAEGTRLCASRFISCGAHGPKGEGGRRKRRHDPITPHNPETSMFVASYVVIHVSRCNPTKTRDHPPSKTSSERAFVSQKIDYSLPRCHKTCWC